MKDIVFLLYFFFMPRNVGLQLHIAGIRARLDFEHLKHSHQKVVKVAERLTANPVDVPNRRFSSSTLVDVCGLDRYQIAQLIPRPASLARFRAGRRFQSGLHSSCRLGRPLNRNVWPAPGSEDTELGVLMELEVGHGETEVYARVQA